MNSVLMLNAPSVTTNNNQTCAINTDSVHCGEDEIRIQTGRYHNGSFRIISQTSASSAIKRPDAHSVNHAKISHCKEPEALWLLNIKLNELQWKDSGHFISFPQTISVTVTNTLYIRVTWTMKQQTIVQPQSQSLSRYYASNISHYLQHVTS